MRYDITLRILYDYGRPVAGGRHLLRVKPNGIAGVQTVIASRLRVHPASADVADGSDFFGNLTTALGLAEPHARLDLTMKAQVQVERVAPPLAASASLAALSAELGGCRSLRGQSPHHFRGATARLPHVEAIASYARESAALDRPVAEIARDICGRIFRDFTYDPSATLVDTPIEQAFAGRRGVCQDFAHIMIAALQSLGIPAGYVSGFLRTIPPPGQARLEGADAMHAWVQVWCGRAAGWIEFDPTNDMLACDDHITVARGRDYGDASPIIGILQAGGSHHTHQAVDVVPVEQPL